jgi:hypothetical protein
MKLIKGRLIRGELCESRNFLFIIVVDNLNDDDDQ